jgi:FHA domain-containing protein
VSVLRSLETKIAGLVEGAFGRAFRSEIKPVELARRLAHECDDNRTVSLERTYVPNEYVIWLSAEDRAHYSGLEQALGEELSASLLEHARAEGLTLVARPVIEFRTDERLALGDCGIRARTSEPAAEELPSPAPPPRGPAQQSSGGTMIFSSAERYAAPLEASRARRAARTLVVVEGRRVLIGAQGAVLGRAHECDVQIASTDVSRRHAEIRPVEGGWSIRDLGSTNGVRVNGRPVHGPEPLAPGDLIELGTVSAVFKVE